MSFSDDGVTGKYCLIGLPVPNGKENRRIEFPGLLNNEWVISLQNDSVVELIY
jgi:hypothetical protein